MNIEDQTIRTLAAQGVISWVADNELHYSSLDGPLTPDLLDQIEAQRPALIARLQRGPTYAPLAHGQQALWFLHEQAPSSGAYTTAGALQFDQAVELDALQRALARLAARHPALRTTFTTDQGALIQVVADEQAIPLETTDAANWNETDWRQNLQQRARHPFDLATGSLCRASLLTRTPTDHTLLLVCHQIVCDAHSLALLAHDLLACYQAEVTGATPRLAPLAATPIDYVRWEGALLKRDGDRLRTYWHQQLAGDLPLLALPIDRARPPVQTFHSATFSSTLDSDLTQQLAALAQAQGTTLSTLLLAAYQVLLHRLTGQDDVIVGTTPALGRPAEFAGVVGPFANVVALRSTLATNTPPLFAGFLAQTAQTLQGALDHQHYPFGLLARELLPQRDASRSPVFQSFFLVADPAEPATDATNGQNVAAALTPIGGEGAGQFDLALQVAEQPAGLRLVFDYAADLFDATTIARLVGHYTTLLRSIVATPTQRIDRLALLTDAERQQLLVDWNASAPRANQGQCLHHIFAAQAARTPDAIAAIFGDEQLTYSQLDQRASQLAHFLQTRGAGPDVVVGLCVERSLDFVVGMLGILQAGAAYLPLDPAYPAERLAFMLTDAEVPLLVTQKALASSLPQGAQVICLDSDWPTIAAAPTTAPEVATAPEHLAYVIYTSGSTGKPKGVAMPHQSPVNLVLWQMQQPGFAPGVRTLQFTPISFDVSCQEVFSTWGSGGTLVVVDDATRRNPVALLQFIHEREIGRVFLPFAGLQHLAGAAEHGPLPTTLREVITAGEQLQIIPTIQRFFEQLPACVLQNQYGMTEVQTVTQHTLRSPVSGWPYLPPIGRPIPNCQAFILDAALQPVPIGVTGELYLGGVQVAWGYLNRPDLTAERFISNPFGAGRLYKTGDLVRYLPDGTIEFLGRADLQVKIRGFRIEMGEIEGVLSQHPDVQQAVVVARDDGSGTRLVAYLVGAGATPADLRAHIADRLPDYMVPTAFVALDTFPLTPSGKVDTKALPAPDATSMERAPYTAPRNPTEQTLATIWHEVLGVEQAGVFDDFFKLGGHSLMAVRLMGRIQQETGRNLPLAVLFQHTTIAALAEVLASDDQSANRPLVPIQPAGSLPPLFAIHPAGGTVFCYEPWAEFLGTDQPVYGLQAAGLAGEREPLETVEEMAANYLPEIQCLQPHGPYYLAGWSLGGLLALEVAQQLICQGETVAALVVVDTNLPQYPFDLRLVNFEDQVLKVSLLEIFLYLLQLQENEDAFPDNEETQAAVEFLHFLDETFENPDDQLETLLNEDLWYMFFPEGMTKEQIYPLWRVFRTTIDSEGKYTPQPYPGRISFFYSAIQQKSVAYSVWEGWDDMVQGGIDYYEVPGDHLTLGNNAGLEVLTQQLAMVLARAREAAAHSPTG